MSWFSNLFKGKQDDSLLAMASQWGEERAVVALASFNYCQESHPEMPKKELYYTVLSNIGITEIVARDIVDDASDVNEGNIGFGLKLPSLKPFRSPICHQASTHLRGISTFWIQRFSTSTWYDRSLSGCR